MRFACAARPFNIKVGRSVYIELCMIKLQNLRLQRAAKTLIDGANIDIYAGDKVAIIGKNGCGKSSLFAMLLGELSPDVGDLSVAKQWKIVSVAQHIDNAERSCIDYVVDGDIGLRNIQQALQQAEQQNDGEKIAQLHEQLEHAGAYSVNARASAILSGLGFDEEQSKREVASFSGGWQMRLNLARALLCPSDLLLLDEPTNHLDLDAVIWLQTYIKAYPGTLLLISHDQAFIDECANSIVSFEEGSLRAYAGNYTSFQKQKAERLALQQKQYQKQQAKREHLTAFINRFKAKASKAKQAQSRVKQLEKMEALLPVQQENAFSFSFEEPEKLPNPLVTINELELGYAQLTVLKNIQFNLVPGSRIGLLGRNGAGKSTFIKLLAGELPPLAGSYLPSVGLKIGYFAQHQVQALELDRSAIEHLYSLDKNISEQDARNYLGGFGFHGDEALQHVAPMSGGERARLVLALIVYTRPNLLLLDEPTNHLDMQMREALAYALQSFTGAMVIVSHDRFLLESVCDNFYLVDSGAVEAFNGDLNDYQTWLFADKSTSKSAAKDDVPEDAIDKKQQKRLAAQFRQQTKPLRDKIVKFEQQMSKNQQRLSEIETKMLDESLYQEQNKATLTELIREQAELKSTIETLETDWFGANEALEELHREYEQ